METMKDLTQQIYKTYNLESEAELARLLGISPQAMNEYNSGRSKFFSDEVAYRIAKLTNKNPAYVFLLREHQRAKDQRVKGIWKDLLEKVSKHAAALLIVVMISFHPLPAKASIFNITLPLIHYMKYLRSWLLGLLRRFWGGFWISLCHTDLTITNKNRGHKWNLAL